MSNDLFDSDLGLIKLGESLGLDLKLFLGLNVLLESQEEEFADSVRLKTIQNLEKNVNNVLNEDDLFFAGSVDFMVSDDPDGKKFFLLETNGGSNRGLSILTKKQQSIMYDGYFRAIEKALRNSKKNKRALVLVGVPNSDGLIHEKILLINYLRKRISELGLSTIIFDNDNFDSNFKENIAFLIIEYKDIANKITFDGSWVRYSNIKLHVLIGDGIARRISDKLFTKLVNEDFRKIKTVIVNPIFKITDDKSLTYLASYYEREILKKYNLKYLLFTKAYNEEDLIEKLTNALNIYKRPFIIKPNGGSGGVGVIPLSPDDNKDKIKKKIKESENEFYQKFKENRSPYPYTIQEMAEFSLIDWKEAKHTFDIRIYLSQKNEKLIIPIGGLARIARGRYRGTLDKQEFVVNLSGFNGQIEVERGWGLSYKNAELLNLNIEDFVNIFSISCIIFKTIAENYQKIMDFSEWDKFIGDN